MSEVNRTKGPDSADNLVKPASARVRRPKREAVRRRVLDAALPVFASNGFESATLDLVAEAAGLTKGAIYSNFASKDDLFFAMMNEQVLHRAEAVQTALAARTPSGEERHTARHIGDLLTEALIQQRDWHLIFLDFWGRAVRDEAVRARFLACRRALRQAVTERVEQALGPEPMAGGLTTDELVTVVLALSNGLAIEEYIDPGLISGGLFGQVLQQLTAVGVRPNAVPSRPADGQGRTRTTGPGPAPSRC